jgi:murein DD-endopeptidase MepM/ murein hydrolase activator NlpD
MARYLILIFVLSFSSAPAWCDAQVLFGTKEEGRVVERESSSSQESSSTSSSSSAASSLFGSGGSSSSSSDSSSSGSSSTSSVFMGRSASGESSNDSSGSTSNSNASHVFSGRSSDSSSDPQEGSSSKGASSVFGSAGRKHNRSNSNRQTSESAKEENSNVANVPEEGKSAPENPRKASKFLWPVDGGHITSFFGWRSSSRFHDGIDIAAPKGTKIFATKSGQVIYSGNRIRGYGNMIVIRHNEGYHSVYAHNSTNKVSKGDIVSQGDVIGLVGNTGHSSGAHVHFEIRKGKYSKDPLKFLGGIPASKGAYKNSDGAAIFEK